MENTNFWNGFNKQADPIVGATIGAGLGGLAMYLMNKHAGAFKELMIDLEDKKAKEHKKTIPVEES